MPRKEYGWEALKGQWPEALRKVLGLGNEFLRPGVTTDCPNCGNKDCYRFQDREGSGDWDCTHCGGPSGAGGEHTSPVDLIMRMKAVPYGEALDMARAAMGHEPLINLAHRNFGLPMEPATSPEPAAARPPQRRSRARAAAPRLNAEHSAKVLSSAIPAELHASLDWVSHLNGRLQINYLEPDGNPALRHNGKPFARERLSATELRDPKVKGKYRSPSGEGCRIYHSHIAIERGDYEKRWGNKHVPVIFTEGELKTESLTVACPGHVTIGLGGVTSWQDRYDGQTKDSPSKPIIEIEEANLDGRDVYICFDSDFVSNKMVRSALMKFSSYLETAKGARVKIIRLPSEIDSEKNGADDFIHRHGAEAFHRLLTIAQPAYIVKGKGDSAEVIFNLPLDPPKSHHRAIPAWSVIKESYVVRQSVGLYRWAGTHWAYTSPKPRDHLSPVIRQFMDAQGWEAHEAGSHASVLGEVRDRLELPDEDWAPAHLISFTNGTLDLDKGEFREGHRREDLLVSSRPFEWNPDAQCPNWRHFVDEAMGSDADLIRLVRAAFRYTLQPKDPTKSFPLEKGIDFDGRKGTGKGTAMDIMIALIGQEFVGPGGPATFKDERSLSALIGMVAAIDTDASGHLPDVGLLNKVISNEPVTVRQLYNEPRARRLGVVLLRAYNDAPTVAGGGVEGLDRRLVVIPFRHRPKRPDIGLKAKLRSELAGIWAWVWEMSFDEAVEAIQGAGGIKAVAEASEEAFLDRNPVARFVLETYPQGAAEIQASDLFAAWERWCVGVKAGFGEKPVTGTRHDPGTRTSFGRKVKKLEGLVSRTREGNKCVWYRIAPSETFNIPEFLGVATADQDGGEEGENPPDPLAAKGSDSLGTKGEDVRLLGATGLLENPGQNPRKLSEPKTPGATDFSDSSDSSDSFSETLGAKGEPNQLVSDYKNVTCNELLGGTSPMEVLGPKPSEPSELSEKPVAPRDLSSDSLGKTLGKPSENPRKTLGDGAAPPFGSTFGSVSHWVEAARDALLADGVEPTPRLAWEQIRRWGQDGISRRQVKDAWDGLPPPAPVDQLRFDA